VRQFLHPLFVFKAAFSKSGMRVGGNFLLLICLLWVWQPAQAEFPTLRSATPANSSFAQQPPQDADDSSNAIPPPAPTLRSPASVGNDAGSTENNSSAETPDEPDTESPPENTLQIEFFKKVEALGQNFPAQEELLQAWLVNNPNDAEARFKLAQNLSWQGKYQAATQEYGILTQAAPSNVDYMMGYAQTLIWAQKAREALPLLQQAKKLQPMYSEIYRSELQAYEQLNDRQQMEATVDLAKVVFPNEKWELPKRNRDVRPMELDMGYSLEGLGNGFNAWNGQYLSLKKPFGQKAGIYARVDRTNRFALQDFQMTGGAYFPLPKKFGVVAEGTLSPTNYVQPKWSAYGEINRELPWKFVAHAGLRHSEYRDAISEMGIYTLENYWKRFRTAYTLYNSYLHQTGWANSHIAQIEYTYGKHENTISISGSLGRELTNLGGERGVLATDVRSLYLSGIQWLHPRLGLIYTLGVQRQGDLYTRKGAELGLRYLL
jgi:YaiO family outer membrane protein